MQDEGERGRDYWLGEDARGRDHVSKEEDWGRDYPRKLQIAGRGQGRREDGLDADHGLGAADRGASGHMRCQGGIHSQRCAAGCSADD
jgi:hypothetical protein